MALTLVVEDGTGLTNSNSYVSVAEADTYNDGHVANTAWSALTTAQKEEAIVMATRVIDGEYQFNGFKKLISQALQWPRRDAKDPDRDDSVFPTTLSSRANEFPEDEIPVLLKNATIELAREYVLTGDTASGFHEGAGIAEVEIDGFTKIVFNKTDIKATMPRHVITMLSKLGFKIGSGSFNLVRA
jgi:hypothetical protein